MKDIYQALVAVEPFTLVVVILNLFLQLFLIKKFLLDKVLSVLDKRREAADQQIAEAQTAKEEARTIKEAYEENMRTAQQDAQELLLEARKNAQARSEEILQTTRQQVAHMKQKASEDIAQEKKKAINEAKNEISAMAMDIAGKVVGRSLEEEDQSRLVDQFIEELGEGL